MARRLRTTHVAKKGSTYYARQVIPADVRPAFGGDYQFQKNTHETDERKAEIKALPWIVEWQARIEAARNATVDPVKATIDNLAEQYAAYEGQKLNPTSHAFFSKVVSFVLRQRGGLSEVQQGVAMHAHKDFTLAAQSAAQDATAVAIIEGPKGHTPWLVKLEDFVTYKKSRTSKATLDGHVAAIRAFGDMYHNPPLETLTDEMAQRWVEAELDKPGKNGTPMNPGTVLKKLTGLSGYWKHLLFRKVVTKAQPNPFLGLKIEDTVDELTRAEQSRIAFPTKDVQAILARASEHVRIASVLSLYMGWRLSELADLKAASVQVDDDGIRFIHGGKKTISGLRDVPVHPDIAPLIDELLATASQRGGYLLHGQPHDRTEPVGHDFTALKTAMGYDSRYAFHCWRHNFATALARAISTGKVSLHTIQELMGHRNKKTGKKQKGDITGTYIETSTMRERLDALVAALPSYIQ